MVTRTRLIVTYTFTASLVFATFSEALQCMYVCTYARMLICTHTHTHIPTTRTWYRALLWTLKVAPWSRNPLLWNSKLHCLSPTGHCVKSLHSVSPWHFVSLRFVLILSSHLRQVVLVGFCYLRFETCCVYIYHLPHARYVRLLLSETVFFVSVFRYFVSRPPLVPRFGGCDFLYSSSFTVWWKIKPRSSVVSLWWLGRTYVHRLISAVCICCVTWTAVCLLCAAVIVCCLSLPFFVRNAWGKQ